MPQVCVSVRSGSVAVNWPVALLAVPPSSCTDAMIVPPVSAGALLGARTVPVTGWVTGPPLWSSTIFGVSGVFVVSVGATVGLISETGSVLVWFSGSGVLVWFVLVGILVGPVLAGGVLSGVVVVNVIFVGELSIGEVLVGAELGPLEPPGAGELTRRSVRGRIQIQVRTSWPGRRCPHGRGGGSGDRVERLERLPLDRVHRRRLHRFGHHPRRRHREHAVDAAHVDRIAGDPVGQGERSGELLSGREIGLQPERRDGVAVDGRYVHGDKGAANTQR